MKSRLPRQLYLECATGDYSLLSQPNLKLVILDLNGTLVWRPSRARTNHPPKLRPGLEHFNKYLFENFAVMVWSSSSPASVSHMVCSSHRQHIVYMSADVVVQHDILNTAASTTCRDVGTRYSGT